MITAYVVGFSTYQEGEDIEVRYRLFEDGELISKKTFFKAYRKPQIVNQVALMTLLKELEKYKHKEIKIVINDPSLMELINGTSTNKNKEVLKMIVNVKEKLKNFHPAISFQEVSQDHVALSEWNEVLK